MAVPIRSRSGGTIGELLLSHPGAAVFTKDSEELALGLVAQVAIALQNARLYGEIRTSREHYRHLVEVLPQLVWTSDVNGRFDSLSPQWEAYTGSDRASHLGWGWLEAVHPDDRERTADSWRNAVETRVSVDCEFRLRAEDGSYRWFKMRALPVVEEADESDRWIGTCTDIEDQKAGELALRESSRMKDELLGLVSHELRTPLTTIVGSANLLQRRSAQLDEALRAELITNIGEDAARLQRLIENMLVLSKAETAADVTVEPILVQHVLSRIRNGNIIRQPERLLLNIDATEFPVVLANETFVEQILENLIRNAEKYYLGGSPIEVSASVDAAGDWLKITVMDKGDELSAEDVKAMFEPFYRAQSATFRAPGLGLGLPVCKRLAEAQGGRIEAKPRAGGGLEVSFLLRTVTADDL
jgi:PAS domain S-box-containing protein